MNFLLSTGGGSGSPISLEDAKDFIQKYINTSSNKFGANATGAVNAAISFDIDSLNRVLTQDGCKGLRLYFGLEPESGNPSTESLTIIVIGIDRNGNDIGFDPNTLEPIIDIEAEERGTKTKSVLSKPIPENNRALLLEWIQKQ